ncbi:MAG TPA: ROK family protein [Flavisolibacter sp.]|nr:ROK family protein [Flavisolibacter sp.]
MDKDVVLGVDIGGSHVSTALVSLKNGELINNSFCREAVHSQGACEQIVDQWIRAFEYSLSKAAESKIKGIGISIPGPFDYTQGISWIRGLNKYENLYGVNIRDLLTSRLSCGGEVPIHFENDAVCFGLGESQLGKAAQCKKVIAITLGTGLGATFLEGNKIQKTGTGVPPEGYLYNVPFKEGIAEDYISTAWLVNQYGALSGRKVKGAKEIYEYALQNDQQAISLLKAFGRNLGKCLLPWVVAFKAECLILGGSLSKAASIFLPELESIFQHQNISIIIQITEGTELSAITGAATLLNGKNRTDCDASATWRKTSQSLLPVNLSTDLSEGAQYNIYPFTPIGSGKIFKGYDALAEWISTQKTVLIDGYGGVDFEFIREQCEAYFGAHQITCKWYSTAQLLKPADEVNAMVEPFLGDPASVWGTRTRLTLGDFYKIDQLQNLPLSDDAAVHIIIGTGAALSTWDAPVIYVDLPKNEIQYRMRARSITNLGSVETSTTAEMYKRFYFVDWVVFNHHRNSIKNRIAIIADGQWKSEITWFFKSSLDQGLEKIAHDTIRVRPWFEAGAWGGQWLKHQVPALNQDEVNYAWSFELIVPENGLVFESDGNLLEVAFDWLMEFDHQAVLGRDASRFGREFPIRFDFLDTFDGGNLSIQCHPSLDYIQKEFGENITQDETYYILDCKDDSQVYLGFREDINAEGFKAALERSYQENEVVEIEQFVQKFPSKKHDFFLIPNGTIHSSGRNNLVLEISATPYIFTFKMYDWLRLDLNGEPRPINIDHAFKNLNFNRKGEMVRQELISRPQVLEERNDFRIVHLPTHPDHFYDVHRIEFLNEVSVSTNDQCHVLMLVEGDAVIVKTANGAAQLFHYAETFVIPAGAGSYLLTNPGTSELKVIKAFIK